MVEGNRRVASSDGSGFMCHGRGQWEMDREGLCFVVEGDRRGLAVMGEAYYTGSYHRAFKHTKMTIGSV